MSKHPRKSLGVGEAVEALAAASLILRWYEDEGRVGPPGGDGPWAGDLRRYRSSLDLLRREIKAGGLETLGTAGANGREAGRKGDWD